MSHSQHLLLFGIWCWGLGDSFRALVQNHAWLFKPFRFCVIVLIVTTQADHLYSQVAASLTVVDEPASPTPCRVHLQGPDGEPIEPDGLPFWRDHFCCNGAVELSLSPGRYTYQIERGPEHESLRGEWEIVAGQSAELTLTLRQLANLSEMGWYSGDLHVHRPVKDMPLLLAAEDLHVAPVITWWNARNPWASQELPSATLQKTPDGRFYDVMAGEDERGGGALLYFGLARPLSITDAQREFPSSLAYLRQARRQSPPPWIEIEKPFWRDVPLWLASGEIDSIGIAHNHLWRSGGLHNEAWGRPRDTERWPGAQGNGRWTQEIYYHALNCGLRIPPSAGSASGVLPNPVGYNRCYVRVDSPFTYNRWWEGLRLGRAFVTNGPLLLVTAADQLPGHVFQAPQAPLRVPVRGQLICREPIAHVEVIHDGAIVETIDGTDRHEMEFATELVCRKSGWFLIRAIVDNASTFRFASTAPFYVEVGGNKHRIHQESARFFQDWAEERRTELAELLDPPEREQVLPYHERAIAFWKDLANLGE